MRTKEDGVAVNCIYDFLVAEKLRSTHGTTEKDTEKRAGERVVGVCKVYALHYQLNVKN